ncbi:MAG: DUF4838 domain-containing protein [Candidatus Latescibacteria bacterium]|jgi:hypothetical protein|nr:DUF4838 domain-containing protein [Candidatus Latescibacterota bacterium]
MSEDDPIIRFAGEELERALREMSGATALLVAGGGPEMEPETLLLTCGGSADLPAVRDPALDDAIAIDVRSRRGTIAGANARAVLIAVYRYLTELGCRWIRPGTDGELIPAVDDPLSRDVQVREKPSYRHRGLAIEGACSCEHVTDLVEWLPRVGMNTYFMEYFHGFIFYNNWYSERHRTENHAKLMDGRQAEEYGERAIEEIKRRGLLFHRAGHGWTCLPLGIPPELWDETIERDFGEKAQYIALYEGKRDLYLGIPRRTNLCYSDPKVREMVVEEVVKYAAVHPEVDYLHFWLADGSNHYCECEVCRDTRPSDFFLMMLNELDVALSREDLPNRIVFLIYLDLLWPPEKETIHNPDRFVMMFAPLHRPYFARFDPEESKLPVPPFVLNRLDLTQGQNVNHLAGWQKVFDGDSFVFDYRFMWGQYDDPGTMAIGEVLADDTPLLAEIGLNGMISDQTQRVFMPSGLPMAVLAQELWNRDLDFEACADDYFTSAFGPDGPKCRVYLEEISEGFSTQWLSTYVPDGDAPVPAGLVPGLQEVRRQIDAFRPVIERNRGLSNRVQARSWEYLGYHADLCLALSRSIEAELTGQEEDARPHWQELEAMAIEQEADTNPVFDTFLFLLSMRRKFRGLQRIGME